MTVRRLDRDASDREVEVAPGIVMVHMLVPPRPGHHGWAVRHACPGIYREEGSDDVFIVAPYIASDLVSEEPLTFSPSILCLGAGHPCGLHGFVTNGVWQDADTPAATMEHVRAAREHVGGA